MPEGKLETFEKIVEMPVGAGFFIRRSPLEDRCYDALKQPGSLVRLKASRGMGKTSFMGRVLGRLEAEGFQIVNIQMNLAEPKDLEALPGFLQWFCALASKELDLANQWQDYWDSELSTPMVNCTMYFEEHLLEKVPGPLVLCVDDLDRIFPYRRSASGFLSLLRAWYEKGQSKPRWRRVRLMLANATEDYTRFDINESPFNVGMPIDLPEFSPQEVAELAAAYGIGADVVEPLMALVGGMPSLVNRALASLVGSADLTLERLLAEATTEASVFRSDLQRLLQLVEERDLDVAARKLVAMSRPLELDAKTMYALDSLGLVRRQGNRIACRCELYRRFLNRRLWQR